MVFSSLQFAKGHCLELRNPGVLIWETCPHSERYVFVVYIEYLGSQLVSFLFEHQTHKTVALFEALRELRRAI